jgi:hypothetical protein
MAEETKPQGPEGFHQQSGDLEAYWDSASPPTRTTEAREGSPPVLFTPLHVNLMDSKLDKEKTSTLLFCRLEAECELRVADPEDKDSIEYETFPAGTLFGIWTKPGMRALKKLGGVTVWMANAGFKEIGKPSPMCLFDIRSKEKVGEPLRVLDDRREKSLPPELQDKRAKQKARKEEADDDSFDMDDVPF